MRLAALGVGGRPRLERWKGCLTGAAPSQGRPRGGARAGADTARVAEVMSAQPLSVSDATRRILEDLGLDTALRGKAALHAAREELGLAPAPTHSKLIQNLQEVAVLLRIELGWAPAQRTSPPPVASAAAAVGAGQREAVSTILGERAGSDAERLAAVDTALREWRGDWAPSRWQARELLGKGGAADNCVVVGVEDSRLGFLAVKFVRMTKDVRLKREAAAMQRLKHENICVCHGYYAWPDTSLGCILLEWLRGGTLAFHISGAAGISLSEREVLDMAAQVLRALGAMHRDSAHLLHRDVKPGNIMAMLPRAARQPGVRATRTVWKLIDFGTAVAARSESSESSASRVSRTLVTCTNSWSKLQGTVPFMAPEVVRQSEMLDQRADLWSLGVTMFQCFSERGALPFAPGEHAEAIIWAARHAPSPAPTYSQSHHA